MSGSTRHDRGVRTRWAAVGAAVAVTLGAVGIGGLDLVGADIGEGDRPVFIPIEPCRLADTRPAPNAVGPRTGKLGTAETLTVQAHGANGNCTGPSAIPTDATALSLNVTALNATRQTFLTFWGPGDRPLTANLNPAPGQPPVPNAVNTPLTDTGAFRLYNEAGNLDVVVDVNGYYAPHHHDDRYALAGDVLTDAEVGALIDEVPLVSEINPFAFSSNTPESDSWNVLSSLVHNLSFGQECVFAPIVLGTGRSLDAVTLAYFSSGGGTVRIAVDGINTAPGTYTDTDQFIANHEVTAVVDATPNGTIGAASFVFDEVSIRDGYQYRVSICAAISISVMNVTVSTSDP